MTAPSPEAMVGIAGLAITLLGYIIAQDRRLTRLETALANMRETLGDVQRDVKELLGGTRP